LDLGFLVRFFRDGVNGGFRAGPAGALRVVRGPGFGALLEVGLKATFVSVFARVFGAALRTGLAEVFRVVLESLLPFKRATTSGVR